MDLRELDEAALSLGECVASVRLFHERIRAPIAVTPQPLYCRDQATAQNFARLLSESSKRLAEAATNVDDVLLVRAALALEELSEWVAANANGDVVGAADAIGDRFYVLLGDSLAAGMPLAPIFEEVHASNMSKTPLLQTGHGHGVKGGVYRPPNLAEILALYQG